MHDLDRMKTKVEIRLGATQVTALAVGAVFSALLFVAGYTVGKSRVPTVAPQPDLQRVLSAVSEERTAGRPAVAAMGEVEFMFPKAAASQKGTSTPQARFRNYRLGHAAAFSCLQDSKPNGGCCPCSGGNGPSEGGKCSQHSGACTRGFRYSKRTAADRARLRNAPA